MIREVLLAFGIMKPASLLLSTYQRLQARRKWAYLANQNNVWLELGAGAKKGDGGWVTVDLNGADICHDLSRGIPLQNNSVDRIYTSHMMEHIPYKVLTLFIQECYRVLKDGGEFSVCVPSARLYIEAYLTGREFRDPAKCYREALVNTGSLLDQVNYIAYMDGQHHYLFDEENLINTIKQSPFTSVGLRTFDSKIDHESRAFESIYASAIK